MYQVFNAIKPYKTTAKTEYVFKTLVEAKKFAKKWQMTNLENMIYENNEQEDDESDTLYDKRMLKEIEENIVIVEKRKKEDKKKNIYANNGQMWFEKYPSLILIYTSQTMFDDDETSWDFGPHSLSIHKIHKIHKTHKIQNTQKVKE